jgi:hypothetical protein
MRQPDDASADDGKIIALVQDCGGNDRPSLNAVEIVTLTAAPASPILGTAI